MPRSLSSREKGSAVIEATVIGSIIFAIVIASASAAIDVVLMGASAREAATVTAVHAARHGDIASALDMVRGWPGATATAGPDSFRVVVPVAGFLPHPDGQHLQHLVGEAEVPLAPYRSGRE